MTIEAATRKISKTRSEANHACDRWHRGLRYGKIARRAYHRAVRRAAAAEIAEALVV